MKSLKNLLVKAVTHKYFLGLVFLCLIIGANLPPPGK